MAFLVAALIFVMLSGTVLAQNGVQTWQEAYPVESYGPNRIVLEKYTLAVANVQLGQEAEPAENNGATLMAMAQYNPKLMGEQGWDSTHTIEYYSLPPSLMYEQYAIQSSAQSDEDVPCGQC